MKYIIAIILSLFAFDANAAGIKKINGVTFAYTSSINGVDLADIASIDGQAPVASLLCGEYENNVLGVSGNNHRMVECTAVLSGTALWIGIESISSGNVKLAIYSDSGDEPADRLACDNTGQAVSGSGAWKNLPLSRVSIVSGTKYWMGHNGSASGTMTYTITGSYPVRYKAATYSTFTFPDPAGSGYGSDSSARAGIAIYGYSE